MVESHVAQFGGDIGKKQNTVDFKHSFLRAMRASNVEKKDFVSEFQTFSSAATTSDWDTFAAVFWVKFPAPKVQAQTFMEYEQILTELRLDEAMLLERHLNTNNYMWKWFTDELY
ncbi:hypothetical protein BDP27DRAFT_1372800 [Rhodocollybia butyracea]|uniref:PRELI/MSF1 domain-containing protein n=1 Tax=Rhodocollybia butyracea TaxID=206335 RepID=A0A9P5P7C2_9AGAR|nr:hypothetical protein BDP27DRAFT_1372800 [Rhodocollybia butyracea]